MLSKNEKLARLKLFRTESIGPSKFWQLIRAYGSGENVLSISPKFLQSSKKVLDICDDKKIDEEISNMKSIGARFVFFEDELYPPLLKNIPDPPPILSFLGNMERVISFYKKNIISVIGARNSSIHANKFCNILCKDLGENDVVIVSGFARGIDTNAHISSLKSGTIAIVACGINVIYPQENQKLYNEIIKDGGIFSEMPFNISPQPQLFPRRNRVIAGISSGTAVIEAAEQSGSLITAKMALDYNRDVFAVPGFPLDPRSIGCNKLIKDGAILIQSAQDILDHLLDKKIIPDKLFEDDFHKAIEMTDCDLEENKGKILNSLSSVPITIDELISCIKVSPQEVLTALFELEQANKIIRLPGQRICLVFDSSKI